MILHLTDPAGIIPPGAIRGAEEAVLRVRTLVCGLPDHKWKKRSYLILRGYIDDSGHRGHSPVMVLGGWIAPVVKWLDFVPEWQAMLDMKPGIDYFKMNEAEKLCGQFKGWSEQRRDERVALAYKTVEQFASFQVSCIINLRDFYRIFDPAITGASPANPYYLAFGSIINETAHYQGAIGIDEKIDFVFDEQVMEKDKIVRGWDYIKAHARPITKHLIGSYPVFEDDKKFLPLQAADLIAWWIRKMATEESDGSRVAFPWTPTKPIPGLQFRFNEAELLKAREGFISIMHDLPLSA